MPGPARNKDLIHLIRFDFDAVHGWEFRIPTWFPRSLPTQFFSRAKYGSMEAAYDAAKAARDQLFAEEELPLQLGWQPVNARNTSGLTGVRFVISSGKGRTPAGRTAWCAAWSDEKRQIKRRFSLLQHGFEGGLQQAIAFRMQKTQLAPSPEELAALRANAIQRLMDYFPPTVVAELLGQELSNSDPQ